MKTIVAVTAQNRKTIFEHAGKCKNFLIYTIAADMQTKTAQIVKQHF